MIRSLLGKEMREHWLPFTLIFSLSLLGLAVIALAMLVTHEAGNALQPLRAFLLTFGVVVAMVVCHRLVVREYQGKTQLFLESLPLTRARMIVVKFVLGLVLVLGLVVVGCAALLPLVAWRQGITLLFAEIVLARAFAFSFFVYSFFFVTGMLGRYRIAIYFAIGAGLLVLSMSTRLEIGRLGPLALMDQTFSFERRQFPVKSLGVTLGLGLGFCAMAFALALVREGSAAALLAEKMSHREKVFVSAVLIGMLFFGEVMDRRIEKLPFSLPGAILMAGHGATIHLAPGSQDRERGRVLAERIHAELAGVVEYLDLAHAPTVFVTTRRDLDANRYELGQLVNGEGILLRVNYSAEAFNEERFLMWLVREFVSSATEGRAELESRMWVLDGFGPFWVRRDRTHAALTEDHELALRALYGLASVSSDPSDATLRDWLTFRERVGEGVAAGVAWSGLDVLSRLKGAESSRSFLRAVLASRVPRDIRALWFEKLHPVDAQMERHAGLSMQQFLVTWRKELESARYALESDLARLPRLRGRVWFAPLSADTRSGLYQLAVEPPPNPNDLARVTLLHANLPDLDTEVPYNLLAREDIDAARTDEGEFPGTWARGARFYSTFSLEVADLGCDVISGWTRSEVN